MPKNKGKGGKNYKKGKKRDEGETRRDLLFKEDGQGILLHVTVIDIHIN